MNRLVTISVGNTKTGKSVPSVSIVPIKDCGNCAKCSKDCYALKAWHQYEQTRKCWTRNSKAFRDNPMAAVNDISHQLARKKKLPKFFRIHVAGDFLNQETLEAWEQLARAYPEIRFLAFTKMYWLDFSTRPKNVKIYLSMWPGVIDTYTGAEKLPQAWLMEDERRPDDVLECPGNCETCGACFNLDQDVAFERH